MDKPDRLHQMIVTHAVRLAETAGPLDDAAAMRAALHEGRTEGPTEGRTGGPTEGRAEGHDPGARIMARAWQLGVPLGYVQQLERLRAMMPVAWGMLMLAVALLGLSIAGTVTADRHINFMLAIVTMLGTHLLTLALWVLGTVLSVAGTRPLADWSLGRMMLALAGRLVRARAAGNMVHATVDVLHRAKLTPWAFGLVSHALWTLIFAVTLVAMAIAFSFRAYEIGWETTILSPGFFGAFVRIVGALPHWFGFPLPDVAAGDAAIAVDQGSWAWWLMGVVTVYGLVPRALLGLLCWLLWRRGRARLQPDLRDPYYARLAERFAGMQEHVAGDAFALQEPDAPAPPRVDFAALGFEVDAAQTGFDGVFPATDPHVAHLAGTLEERRSMLERLAQSRPRRLLVAVDAWATPDRGTERFLREAYSYATHGALLLACPGPRDAQCDERWRAWLDRTALSPVPCFTGAGEAAAWTREGHV